MNRKGKETDALNHFGSDRGGALVSSPRSSQKASGAVLYRGGGHNGARVGHGLLVGFAVRQELCDRAVQPRRACRRVLGRHHVARRAAERFEARESSYAGQGRAVDLHGYTDPRAQHRLRADVFRQDVHLSVLDEARAVCGWNYLDNNAPHNDSAHRDVI